MTQAEELQRHIAFAKSGGVCEVCGKKLNNTQGAHRIANTLYNRRHWGSFIIDHPDNIAIVCSLKCNDKCNIGNNQGECLRLVKQIVDKALERY